MAQADAACVVVDYGCPDRSGDWVARECPAARVVRVPGAEGFNPSHARNLGVAAAETDIVCLVDADTVVGPGFVEAVTAAFDRRAFYVPEPLSGDLAGTVVCDRAAFRFVDGYDEACSGWGGEDIDLYDRFVFHGLARRTFPAAMLSALPHDDAERTAHHVVRDKHLSNSANLIYSHVKLDLMRLANARLPLEFRQGLHARVAEACARSQATGGAVRIDVPYADVEVNFCTIASGLSYSIDVTRPGAR